MHSLVSKVNFILRSFRTLLLVTSQFDLDTHISPVCLPSPTTVFAPGASCFASGWGKNRSAYARRNFFAACARWGCGQLYSMFFCWRSLIRFDKKKCLFKEKKKKKIFKFYVPDFKLNSYFSVLYLYIYNYILRNLGIFLQWKVRSLLILNPLFWNMKQFRYYCTSILKDWFDFFIYKYTKIYTANLCR